MPKCPLFVIGINQLRPACCSARSEHSGFPHVEAFDSSHSAKFPDFARPKLARVQCRCVEWNLCWPHALRATLQLYRVHEFTLSKLLKLPSWCEASTVVMRSGCTRFSRRAAMHACAACYMYVLRGWHCMGGWRPRLHYRPELPLPAIAITIPPRCHCS